MLYTVDCHCSHPKSCCILLLDETKKGTTSITNLDGESGEKKHTGLSLLWAGQLCDKGKVALHLCYPLQSWCPWDEATIMSWVKFVELWGMCCISDGNPTGCMKTDKLLSSPQINLWLLCSLAQGQWQLLLLEEDGAVSQAAPFMQERGWAHPRHLLFVTGTQAR